MGIGARSAYYFHHPAGVVLPWHPRQQKGGLASVSLADFDNRPDDATPGAVTGAFPPLKPNTLLRSRKLSRPGGLPRR